MKLFDLSLKISGFEINKAKRTFLDIQFQSEKNLKEYQETAKQSILSYHLKHNTFYQKFAEGADVTDWSSVPILTKFDLQQPLENRLSNGFSRKNIYINKTSGSSGHPFIFAKDKWSHALTWAEIMNRFSWYSIDFNSSKQARFYGIPLDKMGYYKERFKDSLGNRYRFSIFDLSNHALEKALYKFKTTPFDYINGYTSAIVQFAKFLKDRGLILKTVCPSLKVCVTTAEMLFEEDKTLLNDVFGVPVVNEYGASELGLIAFQNPNNDWRLNTETLLIEVLDEENLPVNEGESGRLVITSLYNKAHPFIRYDLGDIGAIKLKEGQPVLKNLIGRSNDIIELPSGKKAAGLTFYYITKRVIENDGNVSEFIIEQHEKDSFRVLYCSREPLTRYKESEITREMERYLESNLHINFEKVARLDRSKSGKLKQFSRLF